VKMGRVAIFVDAGYLFAQGSTALAGIKRPRTEVSLTARSAIEELKNVAKLKAPTCELLRIYWYDGTIIGSAITSEQAAIADLDDAKLRLGFVNSHGEQKGVDSLIVTDMIELARQKAICDAVLLSGDEDVRIGVQIAQNYGVRVHLLGIVPSRGSQARTLRQEADTTTEWDRTTVEKFLAIRATVATESTVQAGPTAAGLPPPAIGAVSREAQITALVEDFVAKLERRDLDMIAEFSKSNSGIPGEFDRVLLGRCRDLLQSVLKPEETRLMRRAFRDEIQKRSPPHSST
jgi:uncharacterized LabA/DUF88 family protein